ncbi:type VI secretion system membrane subunit TssM [Photobacterium sp. J15]|uniref:type VI secretion system membrane subunit TssM n=1 Tax=Photobacterium sp. J15 TaxID=265901 RepID=UPI0007E30471|nr:type VI secretion system membrane subunit TssM [Photobacterium sp. J15]
MFKKGLRRIGQAVCSRWAISLLGLLAISLLIWFGGPLIAIAGSEPLSSTVARLSVLLALVLVWALINIFRMAKSKREDEKAVKSLLDNNDGENIDAASQREIDTLRTRIVQALDVLSKSTLIKGKSVYQLPWYILIGPPGTGKTTALLNSGMEFPLKDKLGNDPLEGLGGTRNCDWWFTNKAVLIDTAGRYTTQDSHSEQDARAWLGFLGLLKKYRVRRPINGAIVTVSLSALLTQTKTERNLHARAIKQRIQELKNQLGMHFPVYVVLTKADLVPGFGEYFADLTPEQREQVWGITFPEQPEDAERGVVGMFNKEFYELLQRILKRVNTRLQNTRDLDNRTLIYEFPRQLRALQAATDDFLKEIFTPNSFEEAPMLRGVYIVSATQQGLPIDRVITEASSDMGLGAVPLKQYSVESKGFFIKRLFEDVIFQEQYLGTVNLHHKKQKVWLRRSVLVACTIATLSMATLWTQSYFWNRYLVSETASSIKDYNEIVGTGLTAETDVVTLVRALDALKDMPAGFSGQMLDSKGIKRVGLYQGDKIGQPAHAAYDRGLQGFLAPYLADALINEMQLNQGYLEYLYETLKTYLMLFDREHYEYEQVMSWLSVYFERSFPGEVNEELRQSLLAHTENLLRSGVTGIGENQDAVTAARDVLTEMPLAERAYQRLKLEFADSHIPEFKVTDILGTEGREVFVRTSGKPLSDGIPGLYTYNGFHSVFQLENQRIVKRLMEDSWVYGDDLDIEETNREQVAKAVREKYYRDYVYEWQQLLADLKLRPYGSAREGLYQAQVLAGTEQPLETLIKAFQKQLRLTNLPVSKNAKAAGEVAANAANVALQHKKTRLTRYLPNEMPKVDFELPGKVVEKQFTSLLKLNEADFKALNESMVLLYNYLARMRNSGEKDRVAYKSLLGGESQGNLNNTLDHVRSTIPAPFNQWIGQLEKQTSKLAKKGSKVHINTLWQEQVVSEYQRSIKGKYPFSQWARNDVQLKDFGRFFGHDGIMDKFFASYLEPFVDTSKRRWRFTKNVGVSEGALRTFESARRIRDAFFAQGSQVPYVEFGVRADYLDQHINNILFELGGQSMMYRHGPSRVIDFTWPDKTTSSDVRLVFTPPQSGHSITKTFAGDWGLFRMLDQAARIRSKTRKDHLLKLEVKGNRTELKLIPNSVVHPFWLRDIERFSCPEIL